MLGTRDREKGESWAVLPCLRIVSEVQQAERDREKGESWAVLPCLRIVSEVQQAQRDREKGESWVVLPCLRIVSEVQQAQRDREKGESWAILPCLRTVSEVQQAEAEAAQKLVVAVAGSKHKTAVVGQSVQSFQNPGLPSHGVHWPRQLEQDGAVQASVDAVQRQAKSCEHKT